MNIPFKSGEDIKQYVSGIHASLDVENVKSSIQQAMEDVADVISEEAAGVAIDHYNSDDFDKDGQSDPVLKKKDEFTHLYRAAVATKGLFHHFIWLEINVSNSGVTTVKSDHETTAYKYQKQEARDALLEQFNKGVSRMIDYLNNNATPFKDWAPDTEFKEDEIALYDGNFYSSNADFTTGETFDATNWTSKDKSEVLFWQWMVSPQKTESEKQLFTGYKDFNDHFDIDKSATFFIRARHIIKSIYHQHVRSRFGDKIQEKYLDAVKDFVAHKAVADAIVKLDFNLLPASIRGPINNEMNKKGGDVDFVRDKLRNRLLEDAEGFIKSVDMDVKAESADLEENPAPMDQFNIEQSPDKKFYSSI